jgi:protocatechuate 3,4-dioxygenase beta subunit
MSKHDHDRGLVYDLERMNVLVNRRRMLGYLGAAGLIPLIGCAQNSAGLTGAGSNLGAGGSAADAGTSTATSGSCTVIPEETAGPYPGDGSNGPNVLTLSGIVRSDIRTSIAGLTGTAEGVPLSVKLSLVNTTDVCNPLAGYAVYLWHCDRDGKYSLYSVTDQNYLRGVQETDEAGSVTFQTIFPACYSGRWPHIHFEIYPSLNAATAVGNKIKTSQLAMPKDACDVVFATTGYSQSVANLSRVTLASDNVFSDGATLETPTVTGSVSAGYVANLTVGIAD